MPIDRQDELFYLVDKNDKEIGSITRKLAHSSKSNIHRSIGIFLLNEKKEMLMQKRSQQKDMNAGTWSYAVGGHVTYGQTYEQTAKQELKEELNIEADFKFVTKKLIKTKNETEFCCFYQAQISSKTPLMLDKYEVDEVKWVKLNKLQEFIDTHDITDWTLDGLQAANFI